MHPQLTAMLAVQDIEREIKGLKNQGEAISIPLEKTRGRRQMLRRDVQTLKDKLDKTRTQQRQQEKDLAELEGKLAAARKRQDAVTNPKQALALETEIETATAAVDKAELAALESMEQAESLAARLETGEERLSRDLKQIDAEIERLGALLKENQDMASALREERIAAVNRMDEETREDYEWLVNKHGAAEAVADVTGGACGGCGSMLLPHQVMKVRNTEELHRCTHCHRFLMPVE